MVLLMPLFRTSRKVQMFGDSLALTIPAMYVKMNEIKKGNKLNIFYDLNGIMICANCRNEEELKVKLIKFIKTMEAKSKNK